MSGEWGFTTSRPTDARYGDDVAKYAMSHGEPGLKTFVREVLQNSNDARLDNDQPARVSLSWNPYKTTRRSSISGHSILRRGPSTLI